VSITPSRPYRPRWWQVWLLPFAAPLVIGVVLLAVFVAWWAGFGGRQVVQDAGKAVGRGIATATYKAMLEGQRIEGVDSSSAVQLPVFWGSRRVGHTKGVVKIGPRPADTAVGAAARWIRAESLVSTNLGARTSILSSVALTLASDSAPRQSGLAVLLAQPGASVIYAGELETAVDTAALAGLVAVIESALGRGGTTAIRLYPKSSAPHARRGQLWLGPGPVILPLQ
jgi:hypothetical protein